MGRTSGTRSKKTGTRKTGSRARKNASVQGKSGRKNGKANVDDEVQSISVGSRGKRTTSSAMAAPKTTSTTDDNRTAAPSMLLEETRTDVLLGRGSGIARHPGNVYFRRLVAMYRPMYQKQERNRKMDIANIIVAKIEATCPPGRFLESSKRAPLRFVQVDKKRALEKTSQALREKPSVPSKQKKDVKRRDALKSMAEVSAANAAFTLIAAAAEAVRKREAAEAANAKVKDQTPSEPQPTDTTTAPWVEEKMNSLSELELAAVMDLTTLSYRSQALQQQKRNDDTAGTSVYAAATSRNLTSPSGDDHSITAPNLVSPELPPKATIDTGANGTAFPGGLANFNSSDDDDDADVKLEEKAEASDAHPSDAIFL
mmetsp:Transcript_14352/g.21034  ORF Transcript_14352/g.21034 Transcript_14352/m.21034 type:complete len:371 (-) Transcript_14352:226-1338(-)|eukprot:CAMPEP_0194031372 /NCGR_PEP_ID=MMETSP0009_2-20130614/4559_1 /TAXON_ID=210454 /ORGANISM="Grammatophora oceanica, Strain CCMP 410" /LENGTH=370 /DNA_ID=CAMNT_0038671513 /DNA_START=82 /DNA_END=1194 /DNA_ORIENTATION=-